MGLEAETVERFIKTSHELAATQVMSDPGVKVKCRRQHRQGTRHR
jgi:hypothetical protein